MMAQSNFALRQSLEANKPKQYSYMQKKEIDQIDRWYNMIDTPGIANIFIRVL